MAKTYTRTGRISWSPLTASQQTMLATVAGITVGGTFSATLDSPTETFLIDNGVISVATPLRRTIRFPFTFDTPNLLTGVLVYTPVVGDILHDAWFEVDTAWNGTSPFADFGTFPAPGRGGWFDSFGSGIDLLQADVTNNIDFNFLRDQGLIGNGVASGLVAAALSAVPPSGAGENALVRITRALPASFVTNTPLKLVVSQNGTNTGADPGSTQGAAVLYLDISTPQAA